MKKIINLSLSFLLISICYISYGQTISQGGIVMDYCPQYASSGTSTRMVTYFRARIDGLTPGETYYYTTRACSKADIGTTSNGAGGSVYLDLDSPSVYIGSPNFNAGNFDSFTVSTSNPLESHWFAFVNSGDTRFNAGNYVYPLITIKNTDPNFSFTAKIAANDSIKVIGFSSSSGSSNGTGIYGLSQGEAKNMVLVYDSGAARRFPVTIGMIEDDKLLSSSHNSPSFYTNNVDGTDKAWGGILPNDLSTGVRQIDRRDFDTDDLQHSNIDSDGDWIGVNTVNPSGGNTSPIELTSDEAALVPTVIELVSTFTSTSEGIDSFPIRVRRKWSNQDTSSITLSLVGGTATESSDFTYPSNITLNFPPGKEVIDTIFLPITDDMLTEGNEVVTFKLINPINSSRGKDSVLSLTILDNDIPTLSFKQTVVRTREGLGDAIAQVNIMNGTVTNTTVEAVVKSKSPLTTIPGEFFLSFNSPNDTLLTFANSLATDSILLNGFVIDENAIDAPDTILVVLRNPSGTAVLGADSTVMFIIADDDAPPGVRFVTKNQSINETDGTIEVEVELLFRNNNPSDFSLNYIAAKSTTSEGSDLIYNPTAKIFSYGISGSDTIKVTIPIIDDEDFEANEVMTFAIEGTVNCQTYTPDTLRITILSDDLENISIGDATTINASTGAATREGESVSVSGITHGFNRRSTGYEFTLIDATGGIQIFDISSNLGYNYLEGDSISVEGTINQVNGVTQMSLLDTIIFHKSGVDLFDPTIVTELGENTEMEHVRVNNVRFIDITNWPTSPLTADGFENVYARTSTNDTIEIRIDAEGPIDGMNAPDLSKYYNLIGIGSQFDNSSPQLSGYYLVPNRMSDIELANSPVISFDSTTLTYSEIVDETDAIEISFENSGSQTIGFRVEDLGTGSATSGADYIFNNILVNEPANSSSFSFTVNLRDNNDEDGTRTIELGLVNPTWGVLLGEDSVITINILDDESSINSLKSVGISIYPNPAMNTLKLSGSKKIEALKVYDATGKFVNTSFDTNTRELSINNLTNGIYSIIVTVNEISYSSQFIKQ